MNRDPIASKRTMLSRALRRRCPRCGAGAFDSYFHMKETCQQCGLHFEREDGYWSGALIINTTVTFASFLLVFVGGTLITWPDVPWGALMATTIAINAAIPVLFYPQSKTTCSALEMSWHPLEPDEIAAAAVRAA